MAGALKFCAVILGAPASGKGTISSRIISNFPIKHVSTGDLLRFHILKKTDIGNEVSKYIDNGQLVPDNFMTKLVTSEIKKLDGFNWLLDGYPRSKFQAEVLSSLSCIQVAMNLTVPTQVIIQRASQRWIHAPSGRVYNTEFNPPKVAGVDDVTGEPLCQRLDDKPETVSKRLQIYYENMQPVLSFYKESGLLKDFAGNTSNEIWPKVETFLERYFPAESKAKII